MNREKLAWQAGSVASNRPCAIMSRHPADAATIPAPRLTRSDSDRSKTVTSWPARCRSAAVAHPAIDPPIMPTLMPVAPRTPRSATREVAAIRHSSGHMCSEEADGTRSKGH
jgi:hypothetical protein